MRSDCWEKEDERDHFPDHHDSGFRIPGLYDLRDFQIAAQADRQEEKLFAAQLQKDAAEAQDHKEGDA
mgnify:CR=1 FL=1